jgi:hypothetical protein
MSQSTNNQGHLVSQNYVSMDEKVYEKKPFKEKWNLYQNLVMDNNNLRTQLGFTVYFSRL